jgi:hypothetical protein
LLDPTKIADCDIIEDPFAICSTTSSGWAGAQNEAPIPLLDWTGIHRAEPGETHDIGFVYLNRGDCRSLGLRLNERQKIGVDRSRFRCGRGRCLSDGTGHPSAVPVPLPPAVTIPTFIDCLLRALQAQSSPERDAQAMTRIGTNRTIRFGLATSVVRGRPEVAFRGHQDRFWTHYSRLELAEADMSGGPSVSPFSATADAIEPTD